MIVREETRAIIDKKDIERKKEVLCFLLFNTLRLGALSS